MAHVVEAGAAAELGSRLLFSKADSLADLRKVALSCMYFQALPVLADEERRGGRGSKDSAPDGTVLAESFSGAIGDRYEPALVVLAAPDEEDGRVKIDIRVVEAERFANPEPGNGEQPEERRIGLAPQAQARGQLGRFGQDLRDLAVGVDVIPAVLSPDS